MLEIGKYNRLRIGSITHEGAFLKTEAGELLLPARQLPKGAAVGDELELFIYTETDGEPVATTKRPRALVGEFALLRVKDNVSVGTFLDWGLGKDLLLPFGEQLEQLRRGDRVLVYVYLHESGRVAASARLEKFLRPADHEIAEGEQVELLVYAFSDLGAKVIINNSYGGLLYNEELYVNPAYGDTLRGYIRKIREDGKIDVTLLKGGVRDNNADRDTLLEALKNNGGFLALGDKSSPEEISIMLRMSKKSFKKAVGGLYRERLIEMVENGIRLRD